MSKNSRVLSGILAATTVGTVCIASKKMAKKYGQPLNKINLSLEKVMNYASKGLDLAEKHFNKQNELDKMLDKAEEAEE
jgi:gamma-glutamyltranspeptidase